MGNPFFNNPVNNPIGWAQEFTRQEAQNAAAYHASLGPHRGSDYSEVADASVVRCDRRHRAGEEETFECADRVCAVVLCRCCAIAVTKRHLVCSTHAPAWNSLTGVLVAEADIDAVGSELALANWKAAKQTAIATRKENRSRAAELRPVGRGEMASFLRGELEPFEDTGDVIQDWTRLRSIDGITSGDVAPALAQLGIATRRFDVVNITYVFKRSEYRRRAKRVRFSGWHFGSGRQATGVEDCGWVLAVDGRVGSFEVGFGYSQIGDFREATLTPTQVLQLWRATSTR